MTDDQIALTQAELDRVLNSVRKDNAEHDEEDEETGVALTQAELDKLFSPPSVPFKFPGNVESENSSKPAGSVLNATASQEKKASSVPETKPVPKPEVSPVADLSPESLSQKDESSKEEAKSNQDLIDQVVNDRAAKIAERKARMAQMLAQANASSPRRIQVIYGSALKTGAELDSLCEGGILELDRLTTELAEIFVDGKLYARGKLGSSKNGHAAIKITQKL